jgi:hypothetical protein
MVLTRIVNDVAWNVWLVLMLRYVWPWVARRLRWIPFRRPRLLPTIALAATLCAPPATWE